MAQRSLAALTALTLAVAWYSPAAAATPALSSKKTLYCDSARPAGTTGCLFPVPVTTWPSWVSDADKAQILELEGLVSTISDIVGGVSMVQGWLKTGVSIATALGFINPGPTQLDQIQAQLNAISEQLRRLELLQLKIHESLFLQSNGHYLNESSAFAALSLSAYKNFFAAHPDYPACLASGALDCMPLWRSGGNDQRAIDAETYINLALDRLDGMPAGLDPVWLDTGLPGAFDPRVAAGSYLAMVAQELSILTWEVGTRGLTQDFKDRLAYRAAFINQILIPNLKEWVHARCEKGPRVPDLSGTKSPLGMTTQMVEYLGGYNNASNTIREFYGRFKQTKTCDYSTSETVIFACMGTREIVSPYESCILFPSYKPYWLVSSPGDEAEMATLERIGLSQWSYQAAHLVGLANDATYAGCFSRAGTGKLLPSQQTVAPLTVASCIQAAKRSGHNFAQLTPTGCYTGNGIGHLVPIRDASCDAPCVANGARSGEMCGGQADASSVFQIVGSPSPFVASNLVGGKTGYVGCYQSPVVPARAFLVDSAETCLRAAVDAKVVYASVEPGALCKLTSTLRGSAPLPEARCNAPCPIGEAQSCGGTGAASVFVTNDPLVPDAPPQLLAARTSGPDSVRLTWVDTSDSETGFRIERRLTLPATSAYSLVATVGANVTSYQDAGLAPRTSYTYRIQTINGATFSAYSNEASATTWPAGAKGPPWLVPVLQLLLE